MVNTSDKMETQTDLGETSMLYPGISSQVFWEWHLLCFLHRYITSGRNAVNHEKVNLEHSVRPDGAEVNRRSTFTQVWPQQCDRTLAGCYANVAQGSSAVWCHLLMKRSEPASATIVFIKKCLRDCWKKMLVGSCEFRCEKHAADIRSAFAKNIKEYSNCTAAICIGCLHLLLC